MNWTIFLERMIELILLELEREFLCFHFRMFSLFVYRQMVGWIRIGSNASLN